MVIQGERNGIDNYNNYNNMCYCILWIFRGTGRTKKEEEEKKEKEKQTASQLV